MTRASRAAQAAIAVPVGPSTTVGLGAAVVQILGGLTAVLAGDHSAASVAPLVTGVLTLLGIAGVRTAQAVALIRSGAHLIVDEEAAEKSARKA